MNGGFGDISAEKVDPRFQTRRHPTPPFVWGPGKVVSDPGTCDPCKIPNDFPRRVRTLFEQAEEIICKDFRCMFEDAFASIMERTLEKITHASCRPWIEPTADSVPIDEFVTINLPLLAPGRFTTVLSIENDESHSIAYFNGVGTALPSSAAFADVEWVLVIEAAQNSAAVAPVTPAAPTTPSPITPVPPPAPGLVTVGIRRPVPGIGSPAASINPIVRTQWSELNSITPFARTIPLRFGERLALLGGNRGAVPLEARARITGWRNVLPFDSATLIERDQSPITASKIAEQNFAQCFERECK